MEAEIEGRLQETQKRLDPVENFQYSAETKEILRNQLTILRALKEILICQELDDRSD
jgi:hypothetical protein